MVSGAIRSPCFRPLQPHFSITIFALLAGTQSARRAVFVFWQCALEIEPGGDPGQPGGVLLHVVELRDLRRGVAQQVSHLPGREGADRAIRLFDSVDQIGGEGVPEGMEASLLQPCRL